MPGQIRSLFRSLRQLWSAPAGDAPATPQHPEVIVHDPAGQGPHDLDDPFFDRTVQGRVADVIANAGQKK